MNFDVGSVAVARLFANPLLAQKNEGAKRLYWDGQSLDPVALLQGAARWSTSERTLALLACELWGYRFGPDDERFRVSSACEQLDDHAMTSVLEALALRAGLLSPEDRLMTARR